MGNATQVIGCEALGGNRLREDLLETPGITFAQAETGSAPRQLDGVQILRGAAASIVVFHHFCLTLLNYGGDRSAIANYRNFAWVGASGVDIFFCISGFVIVYSLLSRPHPVGWRAFAMARIKRVIPLYWIFTFGLIVIWITGRALTKLMLTPDLIIRSLLLMPLDKHVIGEPVSTHPILDQGWTLQYEAIFYIVCGLVIAILGSKRVFPWVPIAVGIVAVVSLLVPGAPAYLYSPLMLEFVGGTLLGWLAASGLLFRVPRPRLIAWGAICLGIVGLLSTTFVEDPEEYRALIWGVPGFLIVLGSILTSPSRGNRIVDAAIFLGAASYSIYLGHGFATLAVGTLLKNGHFAWAGDGFLVSVTAATILATALIYPMIERPITKWIK